MSKKTQPGFATRAIHTGQEPDPLTGAVTVPIYPTSTYVQEELGKHKGYEYSRVSNPTRDHLETNLAALEGGVAAKVFASGMAAINAVFSMLKSGDHVVCGHDLYGGVPRLCNQVLANFGLEFNYVNTTDPTNVERAIRKSTRMVYIETPTNPTLEIIDIAAVAKIALRNKESLCVIRASENNVLMLETLYYPDEVRTADLPATPDVMVSQPELAMALSLVEMLQEPFDPKQYSDNYRLALLDVIEAKRNGQEIVAQPEAPLPQTVDLMAALKASLEAAKKSKGGAEPTPIAPKEAAAGKDEPEETEELAVAF